MQEQGTSHVLYFVPVYNTVIVFRTGLYRPVIRFRSCPPRVRLPSNRGWPERSRAGRQEVSIFDSLRVSSTGRVGHSIGTTKRGIGPAYSGKASRSGLRVHHLFDHETFAAKFRKVVEGRFKRYGHFEYDTEGEIVRYKVRCAPASLRAPLNRTALLVGAQALADRLRPYVVDSVTYIHRALADGKRILVEGANALMLDIDFGTYPFVTSSSTAVGGVCTGLGIPPKKIGTVIGVMKAYTTRVGGGPFPSEQLNVRRMSSCGTSSLHVFTGYLRTLGYTFKRLDASGASRRAAGGAVAGLTSS